jgi:hypothetical protein
VNDENEDIVDSFSDVNYNHPGGHYHLSVSQSSQGVQNMPLYRVGKSVRFNIGAAGKCGCWQNMAQIFHDCTGTFYK